MGFRFRKSKTIGPFRINASKSGLGWSVGTKGFRYTKRADGKTQKTYSIPGTGISYIDVEKEKSKDKPQYNYSDNYDENTNDDRTSTTNNNVSSNDNGPKKPVNKKKWAIAVAAIFVGLFIVGSLINQPVPQRTSAQVTSSVEENNKQQEQKKAEEKKKAADAEAEKTRIAKEEADKKAEEERVAKEEAQKASEAKAKEEAAQEAKKKEEAKAAAASVAANTGSGNSDTTKVTSNKNNEQMVYVTATGKCYHNKPNCGNTKSARKVTLSEAQSMGLNPCKKCFR